MWFLCHDTRKDSDAAESIGQRELMESGRKSVRGVVTHVLEGPRSRSDFVTR